MLTCYFCPRDTCSSVRLIYLIRSFSVSTSHLLLLLVFKYLKRVESVCSTQAASCERAPPTRLPLQVGQMKRS